MASAGATRWRMLTPLHHSLDIARSAQGGGSEVRAVVIGADNALGGRFLSTWARLAGDFAQILLLGPCLGGILGLAADAAAPLAGDFSDPAQRFTLGARETDAPAAAGARAGRNQREL